MIQYYCITLYYKVKILFKYQKTLCYCPLFVFIPYTRFHIAFSCIEQLQPHATNSDNFSFHFYSVTNTFLISLVMVSLIHLFKNKHLISKPMGLSIFMLISHFDPLILSFKSFFLCNHPFRFFSLITLLKLSMAKYRSLLVTVTLHVKICGLFSNIFRYGFLT